MKITRWIMISLAAGLGNTAGAQSLTGSIENTQVFKSYFLINAQTTEVLPRHGFQFVIRHRFGAIEPDKTLITEFLGMDITANIQFAFAFPLGNNMMFSLGRTKTNKTYFLDVKRVLMKQSGNGSRPVSVALYFNSSIKTDEFKPVSSYTYFTDGTTPFVNKFNHRLYYNSQLIVSRNFFEKFSIQAAMVYNYYNLSMPGKENHTLALPFSASVKTGLSTSIIAEYGYIINNQPENNINPLSVGFEYGTAGHIFQVTVSSSKSLHEGELYTTESYDYTKGEFLLGFNLKRTFWHKKKLKRLQQSNQQQPAIR